MNPFEEYTKRMSEELGLMKKTINENLGSFKSVLEKFQDTQTAAPLAAQPVSAQPTSGAANAPAPIQGAQQETVELPVVSDDDDMETKFQKLVQYVDFLGLQLQNAMNHGNTIAEMLNKSINYSETIGTVLNEHINHTNFMTTKMNETLAYAQTVGQKTNEGINFANYLSDVLENLTNYSNLLAIRTNEAINHANYISDVSEAQIKHNNYLAGLIENKAAMVANVPQVEERNLENNVVGLTEGKVNNAPNYNKILDDVKVITQKITEDSNGAVLEKRYPFLKFLNEAQKQDFYKLDTQLKQEIVATLESSVYTNTNDVLTIINAVLEYKNQMVPNYIKYTPNEYKPVYEGLTDNDKQFIANQANSGIYKVNTAYQVKSFWDSLRINNLNLTMLSENRKIQALAQSANAINESQSKEGMIPINKVQEQTRGYSNDYVANMIRFANRK